MIAKLIENYNVEVLNLFSYFDLPTIFPVQIRRHTKPFQFSSSRAMETTPPIRWRRGDLIGSGVHSRVYQGTNPDTGEQLAVKQVTLDANGASEERVQANIRELEEEVDRLKNLSHPNIVRYLGRAREEDALNILMEFVPGESVASVLERSRPFPESVIRMYTKQLLQGLEYLHRNGIMHRGIRGANIFVDDTGCIRLADVGVSGKVFELFYTMTGHDWMSPMVSPLMWKAPEVVRQSGYNLAADIWSIGCTVIEMAIGDQPWCQYEKVAAIFLLANSKRPPPIPEHLSEEAKDFLKKCLNLEANLRASVSELLKHPFVTIEYRGSSQTSPGIIISNIARLPGIQPFLVE